MAKSLTSIVRLSALLFVFLVLSNTFGELRHQLWWKRTVKGQAPGMLASVATLVVVAINARNLREHLVELVAISFRVIDASASFVIAK
ncbi:hypothetical protein IFM89_026865 [Coptis chinensis]|uniref:Uncharacterized protein n=1 Tax=Coptis chinensis TaxID=261450 RepID=A0A835HHC8_9MAGN|nr:hypothetical protein IFM89_026865 [Coptis chinensis]